MHTISGPKAGDALGAQLLSAQGVPINMTPPKFHFDYELVRAGKVIDRWRSENQVTTEGAKSLLDVYFGAGTQITTWYCGLISSASYSTTPAITNVASNLSGTGNGWAECSASYAPNYSTPASTARGTIAWSASSGTSTVDKASSASVDFTFSGSGTVKGAFIASNGTRLNATGVLYSASLFSADKTVASNDILKVSITARQTI